MLDKTQIKWPPDYDAVLTYRQRQMKAMRDPKMATALFEYYRTRPVTFISDWCDTYDPRNAGKAGKLTRVPLVLFPRQIQMVEFLKHCLRGEQNGLIEKSRDMGATWVACAFSVHLWLFADGASIGWGSRKADLVHRTDDMDSIFEKIFYIVDTLPPALLPIGFDSKKHATYMKLVNPQTDATITGESGDDIGRGGRKLLYFKDESSHYEHPESIEAALADTTRVQIDISSVAGLGNVFHRRRESGVEWEPGVEASKSKTLVFVMDWRDHPEKSQSWYDERREKAADEGLLHIFAQEVDRDYGAAVENVIIPAAWVNSAIDAHKKIKGLDEGAWMGALDVADGGGDRNALVKRKGVLLTHAEEWGDVDTGKTARRAVSTMKGHGRVYLMYDCIGVGSGVKAESNRLMEDKIMPDGVQLVAWDAGSGPLRPDKRVVEMDRQSPLNKDFYANLKAQGWWMLRRRFERTHRAITQPDQKFSPDELISLSSTLPKLHQIRKELTQPTYGYSGRMKLLVEKRPEGMRSPNIGDAIMMCYWPVMPAYDATLSWVA